MDTIFILTEGTLARFLNNLFSGNRPEQLAVRIGHIYLSMHLCDDGYDYTYYDEKYNVIDGGVYDDFDVDILKALAIVILDDKRLNDELVNALLHYPLAKALHVISFEDLEENIYKKEGERKGVLNFSFSE